MKNSHNKAKDMFETAMEEVFRKVDVAKAHLEHLTYELEKVEMSEQKWQKLDGVLLKARNQLDSI